MKEPAASFTLMIKSAGSSEMSMYLPEYMVPQLRISSVSDQFGVQKGNSNNFHIYTLSKLHFIQSIRVMHCEQGGDIPIWEFRV